MRRVSASTLLIVATITIGLAAMSMGVLAYKPRYWPYSVIGESHRTRVTFDNGRLVVVFDGVSPGEGSFAGGSLIVSGIGFSGSSQETSTGYVEKMKYSWGEAAVTIGNRTVRIVADGTKLLYEKHVLEIPKDGRLYLTIDEAGMLSERREGMK